MMVEIRVAKSAMTMELVSASIRAALFAPAMHHCQSMEVRSLRWPRRPLFGVTSPCNHEVMMFEPFKTN